MLSITTLHEGTLTHRACGDVPKGQWLISGRGGPSAQVSFNILTLISVSQDAVTTEKRFLIHPYLNISINTDGFQKKNWFVVVLQGLLCNQLYIKEENWCMSSSLQRKVITQKITPLPPVCATGTVARWSWWFLLVLTVGMAPGFSHIFFHLSRAPYHLFFSSEERSYYICLHHATISRSLIHGYFS